MKKIFLLLICICLTLNISTPVCAQEISQKVGDGYTAEGVYYEVFLTEDMGNNGISLHSIGLKVSREVRFSGLVTPPRTLPWSEEIAGVTCSGELTLSSYVFSPNETVAIYTGILYEQ